MPIASLRSTAAQPASSVARPAGQLPGPGRFGLGGLALVALSTVLSTGATLPGESTPEPFDMHVASHPDETDDRVGGAAARLRIDETDDIPGELYVLFGRRGSTASARVYDETPYTLIQSQSHPEVADSSAIAADVVGDIVDEEISALEMTSAPAGGSSVGLAYAIGHLNLWSDGGFTDGVAVAATGSLDVDGYVGRITAINEKTAAAHLAGADVMFTSTTPAFFSLDEYASTYEGNLYDARRTGRPLADERDWDHYEWLGSQRDRTGMDVIGVAHIGDVAAYLCGAGSIDACEVRSVLDDRKVAPVEVDDRPVPGVETDVVAAHGAIR